MGKKTKFYHFCDKASMALLALFTLECVLGSSGRWLAFGGISIRMILFALCFVATLPNVLRRLSSLSRNASVILTVLFGAYLVVGAVIGWRQGNAMGFIKADITSYLTLALLPGFLATITSNHRVGRLMEVIFYGALALGMVTAGLHFYLAFASGYGINAVNDWLNDHAMGGLANLGTGVLRVYMRSQIFLQVGLIIGVQCISTATGWRRWLLLVAEAVIAFACLITFTRGFWLGFVISAVLLLALEPAHWKKYLTVAGITAGLLVVLFLLSWLAYGKPLAALEFAGRFDPDLIAGLDTPAPPSVDLPSEPVEPDANEAAVLIREQSLARLGELISQRPFFGNGLGKNLDGIRSDGKTEYMYHDVLMKLGAVGFALFAAVFFLPVAQLLKKHLWQLRSGNRPGIQSTRMQNSMLTASFLGVAITSYVNPFLINPMGILLVLVLAAAARATKSDS